MKRDYEHMSVFEQIADGLKDSIAQARGELSLRTTTLPAPAPRYSKSRVIAIRKKTGMSQAVLASYLNVPTKTLQSWEQGAREPKASEARFLQVLDSNPELLTIIAAAAFRTLPAKKKPKTVRAVRGTRRAA